MPTGFAPDYAVALYPYGSSSGIWRLANGGSGSLIFSNSVNLTPLNTTTAANYTFSFDVRQIGLIPNSGATFQILGTYISDTGYRSQEAICGNDSGNLGYNPFTVTSVTNYTIKGPGITLTSSNWGFASKQFRFTLTGPAGSNAVIAASTNLLTWTPLVTNPLGSGTLSFTDAVATNFPRRFYRAALTP